MVGEYNKDSATECVGSVRSSPYCYRTLHAYIGQAYLLRLSLTPSLVVRYPAAPPRPPNWLAGRHSMRPSISPRPVLQIMLA